MKNPFKSKYNIGQKVNYHSIIGGPITLTNREIRAIGKDHSGRFVYFLKCKSGYVAEDALSEVKNKPAITSEDNYTPEIKKVEAAVSLATERTGKFKNGNKIKYFINVRQVLNALNNTLSEFAVIRPGDPERKVVNPEFRQRFFQLLDKEMENVQA